MININTNLLLVLLGALFSTIGIWALFLFIKGYGGAFGIPSTIRDPKDAPLIQRIILLIQAILFIFLALETFSKLIK